MRNNKGSITLFSMMALLLITAALFSLLEGVRYIEIRRFADLQTEIALESAFANYNNSLWEKYGLLAMEQKNAEDILMETANGRIGGEGVNFLLFQAEKGKIEDYTLLTDGHGTVFINSVSSYIKDNLLYETAKVIYNQYEVIKNLLNTNEMDMSNIDKALEEIEMISMEQVKTSVGSSGKRTKEEINAISILEEAKRWKENGFLDLFFEDSSKLSNAKVDFGNDLFARKLAVGKGSKEETSWMDYILLQHYIVTYLSHFGEQKEGRALTYEAEYLLGQKSSDKENLMAVITKIFTIREAANFLYLISDSSKGLQAETLAVMLGGNSLNPIIIEAIKLGILTAWALGESVLDIRALLAGKKIPLLKSSETWTLSLENIGIVTQKFHTAEECEWGLGYENYLGMLLLFIEEEELALRTMNVQEATIRKDTGDISFGMDTLIVQTAAQINYTYKAVFPFLKVIDAEKRWEYKIWTEKNYGYY